MTLPNAPRGPTGMGPPDVKVPGADGGRTPRNPEDMRHPTHVWTDTAFAQEPLERLLAEYERHIGTGPNKLSPRTQRKYMQDLRDFLRSLKKHEMEPVLGSLTPATVSLWTGDQEERGNVVDSIAVRVISLKTFTNKYICKTLELTNVDLLRQVSRLNPKPKARDVLSDSEIEHLLAVYDGDTFEEVRDRAILATLAVTGLRRSAVRMLPLSSYDRVTGEFTVLEKGNVVRSGRLGERAKKYMRVYLARCPERAGIDQLWLTERHTA